MPSYSKLSTASQAIHLFSFCIGYSFFWGHLYPHLEYTGQISTHPSRLSSNGTSSGKASLISHLCGSNTLVLFLGFIPCLPWGTATYSGNSLDRSCSLLRSGTGFYLYSETVWYAQDGVTASFLLHVAAGLSALTLGYHGVCLQKAEPGRFPTAP